MIYVEKEKDDCSFVSVNTIARGRILPPNNAPLYPIKEQTPPESSAQSNEVLQLKKLDSNEKAMEGIGENVANSKTDLISSPYAKFVSEVKELTKEKQEKANAFWAMKGIEVPPLSETNINYRNSLAQKAGGSDIAIMQASLVVIGYDLGTYGPNKNGVDGYMGPATERAIEEFQSAAGLNPTGKMDEQTMIALELAVDAGLTKTNIKEIWVNLGYYSKADQVVATARQYIKAVNYELGAKYNTETGKYENEYKYSPKHIYSEPTLDCSGFTKKIVMEATGYILADGSVNQKEQLGTQEKAVIGGLVFIGPRETNGWNHIMIVSEVDEQGRPLRIIDSSSSLGVSERKWLPEWSKRNPQYLRAPWLE